MTRMDCIVVSALQPGIGWRSSGGVLTLDSSRVVFRNVCCHCAGNEETRVMLPPVLVEESVGHARSSGVYVWLLHRSRRWMGGTDFVLFRTASV